MPVKSKAQRRFMGAVAAGKVPGVKASVGKEFLSHSAAKNLPEHVGKKKGKKK